MSDPSSTRTRSVSRRTIVKGAAWAAPAVAMVSAAPAFAASSPLNNNAISGYVYVTGNCNNGTTGTLDYSSLSGTYGLFITNTTTTTSITNVSIIFYVSVQGLTWKTGDGNSGWSAPVSTGTTITVGTTTFYGYKSILNNGNAVAASNGTTKLPNIHVVASKSGCFSGTVSVLTRRFVTINGNDRSYDNGVATLNFGGVHGLLAPAAKSAGSSEESQTSGDAADGAAS